MNCGRSLPASRRRMALSRRRLADLPRRELSGPRWGGTLSRCWCRVTALLAQRASSRGFAGGLDTEALFAGARAQPLGADCPRLMDWGYQRNRTSSQASSRQPFLEAGLVAACGGVGDLGVDQRTLPGAALSFPGCIVGCNAGACTCGGCLVFLISSLLIEIRVL